MHDELHWLGFLHRITSKLCNLAYECLHGQATYSIMHSGFSGMWSLTSEFSDSWTTVDPIHPYWNIWQSRLLIFLSNCMECSSRLSEAEETYLNFHYWKTLENILFQNFVNNVSTFQDVLISWYDVHCCCCWTDTSLRYRHWRMCFELLLQAFARWQPGILFDIAAHPILEYPSIDSYSQPSLWTQFKVATVYSIHNQSLSWCSTGLIPNFSTPKGWRLE